MACRIAWLSWVCLLSGCVRLSGGIGLLPGDECARAKPEWIFCSGFEEGSGIANLWQDIDSHTVALPDPGPLDQAGNTVMRFRVGPGSGGAGLVRQLPQGYDALYLRWYVKFEPGFDLTVASLTGGLHGGDRSTLGRAGIRPDGADMAQAVLSLSSKTSYPRIFNIAAYYRGMYQDCADPAGQCWADAFPCVYDPPQQVHYCTRPQDRPTGAETQLQAGRWYRVEMRVALGSPGPSAAGAGGNLQFWLDGQSQGTWGNLWFRTSGGLKLDLVWLFLYFGDASHSAEGIMIDNVVVSSQPIGGIEP